MRINTFRQLFLWLVLGAHCVSAHAPIETTIPFEFYAGTKVMPAGEYRILSQGSGLLWLTRSDREAGVFLNAFTIPTTESEARAEMIFHRYGNAYYLSEVWHPEVGGGWGLKRTPREQEGRSDAGVVRIPIADSPLMNP